MAQPKRILFFSLTYYPFIGGAEVAIKEVTDRIPEEKYSFDMITLRFNSDLPRFERFGSIDIFRIGFGQKGAKIQDFNKFPLFIMKYLYPFWALAAAVVLHRRKPYDAIATVMTSYASFAALFFKFLFPGVPYIVRLDDGDPFEHYRKKARITGPLFGKLFTKADFAVTASTYLSKMAREMGYKKEIAIVPNGVNAELFSKEYSAEELNKLKKKLGKKDDDFYLITTSRLVKKNASDDVIRAMPLLPQNVKFLILGVGPDEGILHELAGNLNVSDRVIFLGQIGRDEIPKYLKISDIFIRPSLSEGFGISFVEAMIAGLPVIATSVGGITDFLVDKETGLFCEVRSPASIAEKVKLIISSPDLREHIVKTGARMARERYDWNLVAKMMKESVFDRVFNEE
ncbi:MAG: glycosyltransferase family 4 protein [Candidatus Paceibacterota bacterium]|jgi:glycosyltransferase involved in cell wall biosynthesis